MENKNYNHGQAGAPPPYSVGYAGAAPALGIYPNVQHAGGGDAPMPKASVHVVQVGTFNLRGESTRLICPHCKADVNTRVRYETGRLAHIAALVLCLVGCWPCCLIPYCVDGCMDAQHDCPNCNRFIGQYRR